VTIIGNNNSGSVNTVPGIIGGDVNIGILLDGGDGGDEGGGGGVDIDWDAVAEWGLKVALANALRGLGPGCKAFLGGEARINELANSVLSWTDGVTIAKVDGTYFNKPIPNLTLLWGNDTFSRYWKRYFSDPSKEPSAHAVYSKSDGVNTDAGVYRSIILNKDYDDPARYDPGGLALAGGNVDRYRRDTLAHEYLHIYTNLTDRGLFDYWKLGEKGYFPNPLYSNAVNEFIANDCQSRP
jgi:hypothetical protein